MQPLLLQNLVEMTAHRDHLRLEVSVLSTLFKLHGVVRVRALELFAMPDGQHCVRARTWSQDGKVQSTDTEAFYDPQRVELSSMVELAQALRQRALIASAVQPDGQHVLWLPLWRQETAYHCLEIMQSSAFSPSRIDVIQGIFGVYHNYQSLLDYSERDALTGLLNRKTFDEQFLRLSLQEAQDSSAAQGALSDESPRQWLAAIDIDHFKRINDKFGHLYGDEVLILVANILRSSFDAKDRVFRFGGEEFVVLLRSVSLNNARKALERLRTAVESYEFPQVGRITISTGFAAMGSGAPVEILGQADQALYHAKDSGRNKTCFYGDMMQQGLVAPQMTNDDLELF
ncbi:GGDEF domain-containing protein [Delftia sp. PS-11]|uniref:GGDEF domain-containing protein n=1 Tax=Delftia sp. PS-11 TaxID=2767222 RepID=UPI0024549A08|nr:GGDEF domain-containing protein [Delftia sp. PS-11]KAJ8744628.1 GGDEF domain-containing protein [Delftia sp. PS-11]